MVMTGNHQAAHSKKIFIMCKHLLYYVKGGKLRDGIVDYMPDLIYSKQPEKLLHPEGWEQSEVEAAHCIRYLTVENETVLDPFLGSGIFGVAALKLNRKFIGVEIDPNILDDAKRNINSKLQNKEEEDPQSDKT
jgi:DNA methylase